MKIGFEVKGVPPKKDGANSMWAKGAEVPRLKALRKAARLAFGARGPMAAPVRLTLRVYADPTAGDLDNFITGVCDGLMAADPRAGVDITMWADLPENAQPRAPIAFADDSTVSSIDAERLSPGSAGPRYEVELESA